MDPNPCPRCKNEIPLNWLHCPHCGDGLKCPNVMVAGQSSERLALDRRYAEAIADAANRGCEQIVREFDTAVQKSEAVLGSSLQKLLPLVLRDRDVVATFHKLAELRFVQDPEPDSLNWRTRRPQAEIEILGSYEHIANLHYAALSINGRSLPNYGEVTIQLREGCIEARASVFEENSAVFVHRHGVNFPPGTRALWGDRHKLCVAKLARRITKATQPEEFSGKLLQSGPTALDDVFVEVHIFGPMTFATFKKVIVSESSPKPSSAIRPRAFRGTSDELAFKDYCAFYNTEYESV